MAALLLFFWYRPFSASISYAPKTHPLGIPYMLPNRSYRSFVIHIWLKIGKVGWYPR